ncbi:MAG: hypothetical protein JJT76_06895 [Clostridiaceae bacterium]|nr:hypothetical protein [Clostridiaceae bacterium]
MATIKTAIQMHDGMSPAFKSINNALGIVINSFESLQDASGNAIDTNSIQAARQELARAESSFNEVERGIREAESSQQRFNDEMRNGQNAADGLARNIKRAVGAFVGIAAIRKSTRSIGEWLGLSDVQTRAETQLKTVMGQRMGTIDIQAVLDATSLQQSIGVVGDEVQLMGAQQVATFLNSEDALQALLPAMNNLAVQQKGVSATGEDMVNIGNMMGKVMQGQVGALSRVGITFTEAQEQVLKYGDEIERATMLSKIITDNVGNMNEAMANTPEGQMQQMRNTWGDIQETVGGQLYPAVLKFFRTINANMPLAESAMMGFATGAAVVMEVLGHILNVASSVSSFFMDNWGWISPIIWGIVAALIAYNAALGVYKGIGLATAIVDGIKATATSALAIATGTATKAQWSFNAALMASPITWIIAAIILLIAVFYGAVAAVNKFAGTSVSATGIIAGAFMTALAFIGNLFVGFYNLVIDIVAVLWNYIAGFAEFFANVFNDPVGSIVRLFANMADSILGVLQGIAKAMDAIFGSNMADGIKGWRSSLDSMVTDIVGEAEIKIPRMDSESLYLDRFDYGDAYNKGYEFGENVADKFDPRNLLGGFGTDDLNIGDYADQMQMMNDMSDTAANTGALRDSMEGSEEELKYLRDLAEKEAVNRFTTAEIRVDMKNDMNINNEMDLDGVVAHLEEKVYETMVVAAEGVHD